MASAANGADVASGYGQAMGEAVEEVFSLMMGIACEEIEDCPLDDAETLSAVIGLAGAMSGTCVLRMGGGSAARIAGALTGMEVASVDDMVKDAVGEVCNMVAGAWKGKLPGMASGCMLSTPTVITGSNYQLHTQRPEFRVERHYRFESFSFSFTVVCESMQ